MSEHTAENDATEVRLANREELAELLYEMNGRALYGRYLGDWGNPESDVSQGEKDRWRAQAAQICSPSAKVEERRLEGGSGWHLHQQCGVVHRDSACPAPKHAMHEHLIPVLIVYPTPRPTPPERTD